MSRPHQPFTLTSAPPLAALAFVALLAGFLLTGGTAYASTVRVTDFGAAGDGITDDSAAIQAAVTSGAAPRTVVFPAGTYVFSDVWVFGGTSIVFEPGAKALSPLGAPTSAVFFGVVGPSASSYIRDISLKGGTFQGRPRVRGVLVAKYAESIEVTDVSATGVDKLVGTDYCRYVTVSRCSISDGLIGFAFQHTPYVSVSECTVDNVDRDGILFMSGSNHTTAVANTISNYHTVPGTGVGGIQAYGSTDTTIVGNTISSGHNDSAGVRFRDAERFWCADNDVVSPGSSGYQVHYVGDYAPLTGGNGTFYRNRVTNAKLRGFDVQNPRTKAVRVLSNTITNTWSSSAVSPGTAIVVVPSGSVIIDNLIQGGSGPGIELGGSGQFVAWNTMVNVARVNFGPRVGLFSSGVSHVIVGNSIVDTTGSMINGVRLYSGSALLRANSITGQTGAAYDLRGTVLGSVMADTFSPRVSFSATRQPSALQVAISATDASGIRALRVSVDGGPTQVFHSAWAEITVSAVGPHVVSASALDRAGNVETYSFNPALPQPVIALTTPMDPPVSSYGGRLTLVGSLRTPSGAAIPGQRIEAERWSSGSWRFASAAATTSADGSFTLPVALYRNEQVRVRYPGVSGWYSAAVSGPVKAKARASLSVPSVVSTLYAGRRYSYHGTLRPRHASGSSAVKLLYYRYEGGRWVYRTSKWAQSNSTAGGSSYSASVALSRGKWRVRALHSDADHAPTYTGYRYRTVR